MLSIIFLIMNGIFFIKKIGGKEKRLRYRGPEGIWSESQEKAEKNLVKAARRHKWLKVVENDECC